MRDDLRDFAIREIGCIIARHLGHGFIGCEKHHLLTTGLHGNGRRRGEKFTVGLSPWSHRGDWQSVAHSKQEARERFGPSYAQEPRAFRELYPDEWLLQKQNELIEKWKRGEL